MCRPPVTCSRKQVKVLKHCFLMLRIPDDGQSSESQFICQVRSMFLFRRYVVRILNRFLTLVSEVYRVFPQSVYSDVLINILKQTTVDSLQILIYSVNPRHVRNTTEVELLLLNNEISLITFDRVCLVIKFVSLPSPEDGKRSSFRNVLFSKKSGRWTKTTHSVIRLCTIVRAHCVQQEEVC
jgi:hypothetical protein